jgi:hypothetical protein
MLYDALVWPYLQLVFCVAARKYPTHLVEIKSLCKLRVYG